MLRSRSFVGSSRTRTLPPRLRILARRTRERSPPESSSILVLMRSSSKRKRLRYCRRPRVSSPSLTFSDPSPTSSKMDFWSSMMRRPWSTKLMSARAPIMTLPVAGSSSPKIVFRRVDLPMPFLPTTPIRSPPSSLKSRFLKRVRSPMV